MNDELRAYRRLRGFTQEKAGKVFGYEGVNAARNFNRWESGAVDVPAPVARILKAIKADDRVRLVFEPTAA